MTDPVSAVVVVVQAAILVTLVEGVRRRDVSATVNALVVLVVAALPATVAFVVDAATARSVSFGRVLPLWLAVAGLLHMLGMLGRYDSTWWWDHLTHTVSAALVAALVYAGLLVTVDSAAWLTPDLVPAVTVGAVFAVGVLWELVELLARQAAERYGVELLVHYGWRDTAFDLAFDLVAVLAVVALDVQIFVPIVAQSPTATRSLLLWSGALVGSGSVLLALLIHLGGRAWTTDE